jgi:hypothetical protein
MRIFTAILACVLLLFQGQAHAQKKHQVTLRWTLPVPNGAVIHALQLYRSNNANLSNNVQVCNVAPTVTSCVDSNVTPNQTYWYYEITVASSANSPKSNVVQITVHP